MISTPARKMVLRAPEKGLDTAYLRIHVVEIMEHDRLEDHGLLGRTVKVLPVVTQKEVLNERAQVFWKSRNLANLFFHPFDPQDNVAEELPPIRIVERSAIGELFDLSEVMKDRPGDQQIEVHPLIVLVLAQT